MADLVALDLEELRHLQSIAKRPRILNLIASEIRTLEKLSPGDAALPTLQIPTPISTEFKTQAPHRDMLPSFSWDQDNDKVKIYTSLEGVDQEKIETDFKPTSFDIKFHDVQGKNYRLTIPKLHREIAPEKCKVLVKPARVVVYLAKTSKDYWLDFKTKEKGSKLDEDEKEAMLGMIDVMKGMYHEGDEDAKQTLAKAWSDLRFIRNG